jgi:hypothetical protein
MRIDALAIAIAATLVLAPWPALAQVVGAPGCGVAEAHTHGCLVTIVEGPGRSESGASSTKKGSACAWNVLRLVAAGDMRISTAQRNGGITAISSVDYETFELVPYYGVVSRYCTVVSGS